jgi:8-oxo-dGTP pyrophosphatase MutT (NUDIX family)
MNYKDIIYTYQATTEQEQTDLELMKQFIQKHDDALLRTNLIGHITSSVFILNESKDKVLMGYHNIYQSWGWFGGHNDGDDDCLYVALKEAEEETGLQDFKVLCKEPIGIDVILVHNHIKKGKFIPDHLHLNITYGLFAKDSDLMTHNDQEHSGIAWFPVDTFLDHVKEERMKPIYTKLLQRMLTCAEE